MTIYYDKSWYEKSKYAEINSATHFGMFLTWCIDNNFIIEKPNKEFKQDIFNVKNRVLTGAEFLIKYYKNQFISSDFVELADKFASDYLDNSEVPILYSSYLDDYVVEFIQLYKKTNLNIENIEQVENNWQNYDYMKPIIDERFEEWKQYIKTKK